MKIISIFCLTLLLLTVAIFSQTATKIDEFSYEPCGHFMMRMNTLYQGIEQKPQNKIYVIYYEEQKRITKVYDKKIKKYVEVLKNPKFGNALNRAKEIPLYLKMMHKIPNNRVVLIEGGFREIFVLEIWSVPEGAEIPKPTPTLERKDVKFSKGKPYRVRDLSRCYSGY